MMQKNVVLEKWRKNGYTNRLVTNGKSIWMEYFSHFGVGSGGTGYWRVDPFADTYWFKVFK